MYKKLDPREHVLQRPAMYIGDTAVSAGAAWVFEGGAVALREASWSPAFAQVFLEVLTNATDHAIRTLKEPRAADRVTRIAVRLDPATGVCSVENNGRGIDCSVHPEYGVRNPELIFGHLLTSSNYDDADGEEGAARVVAGCNGLGCKLSNIFACSFRVETVDGDAKLRYSQEWSDNMSSRSEARVEAVKGPAARGMTRVSYLPDYRRFGMSGLDADALAVLAKCALDACAVTPPGVRVSLSLGCLGSGTESDAFELPCRGFAQYVRMYAAEAVTEAFETPAGEWEVGVAVSPEGGMRQVSFVNGLCTPKGGKHVEHVAAALCRKLCARLSTKTREVAARSVRAALWVFVRASVPNPSFDSQNKHTLTSPLPGGFRYEPSDAFVRAVLARTGVQERVGALGQAEDVCKLRKTDGAQRSAVYGIPKLDDANWAGTRRSRQCTLILTEGDSAKSTAIAGLAVVGRDRFGVFPLRGKLLNVRDASPAKIGENEEIKAIKKIVGLESGRDYETEEARCRLRYGSIMMLTDQDSVTGDTPLLLRDPETGDVQVRTIDDLGEAGEWTRPDGSEYSDGSEKEYSTSAFEVWTEAGWTRIKRVMRHRTSKRLFRVATRTGCVDVTEDHSLLDADARELRPGGCRPGTRLLHAFPEAPLRFAGGADRDRDLGRDGEWTETTAAWAGLRFRDGGPPHRVPSGVLNGPELVRRAFVRGCSRAREDGKLRIAAPDKRVAMELYCLLRGLWAGAVEVGAEEGAGTGFCLLVCPVGDPSAVTSVVDLGVTEGHVYDLETENHHFHAGVGQMIVHNTDGFHIKGLILNLFHSLWPALARQPGFLRAMMTPIVRARRGKAALSFYGLPAFEAWRTGSEGGWSVKYYKGLGTSTCEDAREYFRDMRTLDYTCAAPPPEETAPPRPARPEPGGKKRAAGEVERGGAQGKRVRVRLDVVQCSSDACGPGGTGQSESVRLVVLRDDPDALDMAFRKGRAEERKRWLDAAGALGCDELEGELSLTDFVNKELVQFSLEDVARSLPSAVDGLKTSQRKVLFGAKKSTGGETRVAQLAAYVGQVSAYHHGEASLQQTIVGMAQDFVGSGHVQLLTAGGQFGSRIMGGKDAASPRYIYTQLSPAARRYFPDADEPVLRRRLDDDHRPVEPAHYLPVLPLALLNGAAGIGTGYSTSLPCFSPELLERVYRERLQTGSAAPFAALEDPEPSYRGYRGTFERAGGSPGRWTSVGAFTVDPKARRVDVTELPVGVWTSDYKAFLDDLCGQAQRAGAPPGQDKQSAQAGKQSAQADKQSAQAVRYKRYESNYTETEVSFSVFYECAERPADATLAADLRLRSDRGLSMTNIHLLDEHDRVRRFGGVREIAELHFALRLAGYRDRLRHQLAEARRALGFAEARAAFVEDVVGGAVDLKTASELALTLHAQGRGWPRTGESQAEDADAGGGAQECQAEEEGQAEEGRAEGKGRASVKPPRALRGYDYLFDLPVRSLTPERAARLKDEARRRAVAVVALEVMKPEQAWLGDLDACFPR